MPSLLVLGARSDIAMATAHAFAAGGYDILLAARDADSLADHTNDIALRHQVNVTCHEFDALAVQDHAAFVARLPALPDVALWAVGVLGDQAADEQDVEQALHGLRANYEGGVSVLSHLANAFLARGTGTVIGISSVAGLRGRASNYLYGSAKAGLTAFLSGLRNRCAGQGVHVLTVLPGFVDTAMTEDMDLPAPLTASADEVGQAIFKATQKGRDVLYVRSIWQLIMLVIRHIPERIFKRLSL